MALPRLGSSPKSITTQSPLQELPIELQTEISEHAAKFSDRSEANSTVQSLLRASRHFNILLTNRSTLLGRAVAALQRHPGSSREEAAEQDFENGMQVLEALNVNHVTGQETIDALKLRGAERDIHPGGMRALEAISVNKLTDQPDIDSLKNHQSKNDLDNGMHVQEIITINEMTNQKHINALKVAGARRDFQSGVQSLKAISDNQADGLVSARELEREL